MDLIRPHEAARTYASVAAVLAGFCFAAVVLIVNLEQGSSAATAQELLARQKTELNRALNEGTLTPEDAQSMADDEAKKYAIRLQQRLFGRGDTDDAVAALLTAFLGLVMSAFLMARIGGRAGIAAPPDPGGGGGELLPTARTFWLMLLASAGLAISALFALWGVADLVDGVVGAADSGSLVTLVWLVFLAASVLATAFVVAAACDLHEVLFAGAHGPERKRAVGPDDHVATAARLDHLFTVDRRTVVWGSFGLGLALFVLAAIVYGIAAGKQGLRWPLTPGDPITPIAVVYLAGFTVVTLVALALSASTAAHLSSPRMHYKSWGLLVAALMASTPVAVAAVLACQLPTG